MDIDVLTVPLGDQPLEDALDDRAALGVELGCGGHSGQDHLARAVFETTPGDAYWAGDA